MMKLSRKTRNIILVVLLAVMAVIYIYEDYIKKPEPVSGEIQIHSIDVGQGDSTLIRAPEGDLLIDAGTNDSEQALLQYLDSKGVKTIEFLILTHPHEDHIGSADAVIKRYEIKNVIMPDVTSTSSCYDSLLSALEGSTATNVIEAKAGEEYSVGELGLKILGPLGKPDPSDLNNASVITKVTYGGTAMLFTGDAESKVESELVQKWGGELDCDFMKLGHHGSGTSNTHKLMDRVTPYMALISCGADNSYGHPHREILSMLEERHIEYYRTDKSGSIVFISDGVKITKK